MSLDRNTAKALEDAAVSASGHAYAPYSKIRVGAAVLCDDGSIYEGANVENRSYGLGMCAERSAMFTAAGRGNRKLLAVTVFSPDVPYPLSPCGACRQVLTEFATSDCVVRFSGSDRRFVEVPIRELFPHDALHELASR